MTLSRCHLPPTGHEGVHPSWACAGADGSWGGLPCPREAAAARARRWQAKARLAQTLSSCQDFKEQIIHHTATIILISVSYCANLVRFGAMVIVLHDASDYILEVRPSLGLQIL